MAQGRLGKKSGQGFFPYPQPDAGDQRETVLLETRGDVGIAWLNRPPANPLSPQAISDLISLWERGRTGSCALVFASSNIFTFSAGADIKEFTKMSPDAEGRELVESAHGFMRGMERRRRSRSRRSTRSRSAAAASWRWPATSGSPRESATFGQPEINLGIIPGFGGTQRLPRLVGEAKALEMNLVGDPIDAYEAHRVGLANQVVPDHELLDTALSWAQKLAGQAPLAVGQIKKVSHRPDLDEGLAAEGAAFGEVFGSEDAKEGIGAFLGKRRPKFQGRCRGGRRGSPRRPPRRELERRGAHRGGDLRVLGDPRLPDARHRALGERRPDGGRPHRRLARGSGPLLAVLRAALRIARSTSSPTSPTGRSRPWRSSA